MTDVHPPNFYEDEMKKWKAKFAKYVEARQEQKKKLALLHIDDGHHTYRNTNVTSLERDPYISSPCSKPTPMA